MKLGCFIKTRVDFKNTNSVSKKGKQLVNKSSSKIQRKINERSFAVDCFSRIDFTNILCAPFCTKVFCKALLLLQFGLVFFWKKNTSAKAAYKMLVKLTTGVNFINILLVNFLYKSVLPSFSLITIWLVNYLAKECWQKSCS